MTHNKLGKCKYKKMRRKLHKLFDVWITRMGLKWWTIDVVYHRKTPKHMMRKCAVQNAHIYADWQYLHATVHVNMPALVGMSAEAQERIVIHELCHALIDETYERKGSHGHHERVATCLTKAFYWTRTLPDA